MLRLLMLMDMLRRLFVWLLLFLPFLADAQPPPTGPPARPRQDTARGPYYVPCARYRSGYMNYTDPAYGGIKILRKGKKEVHLNENNGLKMVFRIVWVGDCAYELTFKKSNAPCRFKKGWKVTYTMVTSYPSYYDFESDLHGIKSYGWIEKPETAQELRAKEIAEQRKADSVETERLHKAEDSMLVANGKPPKWNKPKEEPKPDAKAGDPKAGDPKAGAAGKGDAAGGDEKPGKKGKKEKKKGKEKGEKPAKEKKPKGGKEGDAGAEKPAKAEKPPKEKKEKAPKEKKEKAPKVKKEKEDEE